MMTNAKNNARLKLRQRHAGENSVHILLRWLKCRVHMLITIWLVFATRCPTVHVGSEMISVSEVAASTPPETILVFKAISVALLPATVTRATVVEYDLDNLELSAID